MNPNRSVIVDRERPLDDRSLQLRRLIVDALAIAGSGHVGPSLSIIEILRVLYDDVMHVDPRNASWPERDRFILSKGHGCLGLYAVLAEKGFFDRSALDTFGAYGSPLGGHPERGVVPGVECSTGALGHGVSVGIGIAYALRMRRSTARVFVLTGDGELNEGSVWEAALAAAHHRLANLCVIVDRNGVQSFDRSDVVLGLEPLADKWRSFGFDVSAVDGHDVEALRRALGRRVTGAIGQPRAVICHTVKGKGLPFAEDDAGWHYRHGIDTEMVELMHDALRARA